MSLRVARASTVSPARRTVHPFSASAQQPDRRRVRNFGYLAVTAMLLGAAIPWAKPVIALVVPAMAGVILLILLVRYLHRDDPEANPASHARLLRWTMAAFVSHLIFGMIVTHTPSAVAYLGGDAYGYHIFAKWIVEFGRESLAESLPPGKEGFYYMLTGLYRFFGPHAESGLVLNATLSAALVPLVTDSTRRLFDSRAARMAAPIVVLMPSFFLFTSQLLKEAPILFFFAVATNAALRVLDRASPSAIIVTALAVALLFTLRAPVALVGGAALLIGIGLGRREVLSGLTTVLGTVAMVALLTVTVGLGSSGVRIALDSSNLAESNRQRTGLAFQSSSAFGTGVDTGTPSQAVSYLPFALTHFAFGPFPWQIRGIRQLPVLFDVMALWVLWPSLLRGILAAIRNRGRRAAVLLLPALCTSCVLALAVGNFGVLIRERMQVVLLLVPFIAAGMALKSRPGAAKPSELPAALPVPA